MASSEYEYGVEPWGFMSYGGTPVDAAFNAFLADSHTGIRFLLDVNAVELSGETGEAEIPAYASLMYGEFPGGEIVLGSRRFFFSDGMWIGRPQDAARPNTTAEARIIQVSDVQRVLPVLPESERRSEVILGEFTLANPDGQLDELGRDYSIAGRPIRLYIGKPSYEFNEFKQIAELFGQDTEGDLQELKIKVTAAEDYLNQPLQSRRYSGLGGIDGDATIAGRLIPFCIGECFNVTPVLINRDQWIYQVHDGPIYGIDAVKERGLALDYSGTDVETYAQLRSASVAAGYYTTCNNLGLVKIGLGVGGPEGLITFDVKGMAGAGGYVNSVGDVLLRLATRVARVPSQYLDIGSFLNLQLGPLGYYADGLAEVSVADVFNALLRGVNGWYGSTRDRLIRIAKLRAPESFTPLATIGDGILSIEELEMNPSARYEQSVGYEKNWTVMSVADISEAVDPDLRQKLQLPGLSFKRSSAEAKVRHLTAIRGEFFDSYLTTETLARESVDIIMSLHRVSRRIFRVVLQKEGLRFGLDDVVKLDLSTTSLAQRFVDVSGQNFLVVSTRLDGREGHVELTLWG